MCICVCNRGGFCITSTRLTYNNCLHLAYIKVLFHWGITTFTQVEDQLYLFYIDI